MNAKAISVLVVEQDELMRKFLMSRVIVLDYNELYDAATIEEAKEKIRQHQPSVILYDIESEKHQPGALLAYARSLKLQYYPFAIALAALSDEKLIKDAYAHGADYYLDKSFRLNELSGILSNISRQEAYRRLLAEKELHYRSLFNLAADPILLVNTENYQIVDCNKSALQTYGLDAQTNQNIIWTKLGKNAKEQQNLIDRQLVFSNNSLQQKADGSVFPASISLVYFEQDEKQLALISVKDMTEIFRQQEEKIALVKILNESNNEVDFKETRAFLAGEENERRRIAAEIHDHVGQLLVSAKLQAEKMFQEVEKPELANKIVALRDQLVETISAVRKLATEMVVDFIPGSNLMEAISMLAMKVNAQTGKEVQLKGNGFPSKLTTFIESNIYRIVEEAITNSIKHASIINMVIEIQHSSEKLWVNISSENSELTPQGVNRNGQGLNIMQQRAALIGGKITFEALKDKKFIVKLIMPIEKQ